MGGKFYGAIGYADMSKTAPGVYRETITERNYTGDVLKNTSKRRDGENLNSNISLDNQLSIVADPFAYANFYLIRYVVWMGTKWQVTSVDVDRPRLKLTLGGVYNEQQSKTSGIRSSVN